VKSPGFVNYRNHYLAMQIGREAIERLASGVAPFFTGRGFSGDKVG